MSYPILGLCGPAGCGKDTVAAMVGEQLRCQRIALADPMKRFARDLFGFSEEQLWGPSEMRNAVDPAWTPERISEARSRYRDSMVPPGDGNSRATIRNITGEALYNKAFDAYVAWLKTTLRVCAERGEVTPRYVLQTMGTEWGRAVDMNVWVNKALADAQTLLQDDTAAYDRSLGICARPEDGPPRPPELITITDVRFKNEVLAIRKMGGQVWNLKPVVAATKDQEATAKAGVVGHASEAEMNSIPSHWFTGTIFNDKTKGLGALKDIVAAIVSATYGPGRARISCPPPWDWERTF